MKKLIFLTALLVLVTFTLAVNAVFAESRLYLTINGISKHYNVDKDAFPDLNERNWGGGLESEFSHKDRYVLFFSMGTYRNSLYNQSDYVGGGAKLRFNLIKNPFSLDLDTGLVFLAVTGYPGWVMVPAVMPTISLGNEYLGVNFVYGMPYSDLMPATLGVQLKIKVLSF